MVLVAEHHRGCDAVLIAVSYDTGLAGARELLPIPVVGMTEAALLTACMLGGRTGIITFGRRGLPLYQELVASYGLADRVAGWRTIESPAPYRPGGRDEVRAEIIQRAGRLIEEDGAETVILSGAVMAGMAGALRNDIAVPVLDGISCGVLQAELLVRLGTRKPIAGSYALPGLRDLVGVAPSLGQAFAERR
jgi:allantoin racemase